MSGIGHVCDEGLAGGRSSSPGFGVVRVGEDVILGRDIAIKGNT